MKKELPPNTNLSHYRIVKQIGAGGMGEVYLAEDLRLHRRVALKFLPDNLSSDDAANGRLWREARAAATLDHPHICQIYEIAEIDDCNFIVMQYVAGETLAEKLTQGKLSVQIALELAMQIAGALEAAHARHIIHRDIKPANIIINDTGCAKVLDFGLAKFTQAASDAETAEMLSTVGVIAGTVPYMSPEQVRGKTLDGRSDVFSFGCVLYEMLSGKPPFRCESHAETIAAILNYEPPFAKTLADVLPELQRIVRKTLAKDVEERYQAAKDLFIDLKSVQKRLQFEAELECSQTPNRNAKEAQTQIFQAVISSETPNISPNNLTKNLSRLIGREKEIAEIENLLRREDVRLVTMTGVGGTGKTRLAQAVAEKALQDFSDGVFFVELAAINDSARVASTIAQTLGVKEAGGKLILETLKDYLRGRQMLLLIDNFEQVIDAAPNIAELLSAAARLKILITSRTLLHLSCEQEFIVPPLFIPADVSHTSFDELSNYEAVKLFVRRARNAKPDFSLTEENANSVAEICARLDGLPLAIELAAARVKILAPQAILTKLENRLKLLIGGARDLPARQQTMRGAIEWSDDLLTENEKLLFRRLAVFAGGFTFEAAEAIFQSLNIQSPNLSLHPPRTASEKHAEVRTLNIDVLDGITSLVDKSLLVSKEQSNGEMRFRMLETVREYAIESLETSGEAEATRRRHAAYFLALGEEAEPHLTGAESIKWLNRLEDEHDNLREALAWLLENDAEKAARLAAAIRVFWTNHSHLTEGRKWLKAALERSSQNAPAAVLFKLLNGLGLAARQQGDYLAARKVYEEGLAAGKAANDLRQIAWSNNGLGRVAYQQGDFMAARKFIKEGLAINRELNDKLEIASLLNLLGELSRTEGNNAAARPLFEESLAISRQSGNKAGVSGTLNNLAAIAYGENGFAIARTRYTEALMLAQELGEKAILSFSLDGFAALAAASGESERAAKLAGASEGLLESIGFDIEHADRRFRDVYLAKLKTKMDEADFAKLYEQGRRLKIEEAVALCLEENKDGEKLPNEAANGASKARTAMLSPANTDAKATPATVAKADGQASLTDKPKTKRNWSLLVLLSFVLLVAGFFVYRYFTPGRQIESIAVLPFINESDNADVEYLSDGMTETLISSLSQLPNLNVKARSSVFRYKGKDVALKKVGSDLSVQAVLTGSLVERGDDLTLHIELVDAATEYVLWTENYHRSMTNLVTLQSEIARDVSSKLQLKLSGADERKLTRNYTANAEAYQLYLKGRFYLLKSVKPGTETSILYFQQAIELDPNYALAYTGLSDAYRGQAVGGEMPSNEFMPKARAAALKAIEIDDQLAEAHTNLGHIYFWYDWNWKAAENQHLRALELDPNSPDTLQFYAHLLSNTGRHAEALANIKRARELDPLNLRINALEGLLLLHAGQIDEAITRLQKTLELDPNFRLANMFAARAYIEKGMYPQAIAATRKSREISPVSSEPIAYGTYALAKSGKFKEARAGLDELLKSSTERYVPPYNIALVYNALGESDKAFAYLEKGFTEKDVRMVWLKVEPKWNNLRGDARFQVLMRKVGFPP